MTTVITTHGVTSLKVWRVTIFVQVKPASLNDVAPFEYLAALIRNHELAAANPAAWLPWNYPRSTVPSPEPP